MIHHISIHHYFEFSWLEIIYMVWKHGDRSLPMGSFCMLFCRLLIFFNFFLKNSFRNTVRVSNYSDPDHDQCFICPDLGASYL